MENVEFVRLHDTGKALIIAEDGEYSAGDTLALSGKREELLMKRLRIAGDVVDMLLKITQHYTLVPTDTIRMDLINAHSMGYVTPLDILDILLNGTQIPRVEKSLKHDRVLEIFPNEKECLSGDEMSKLHIENKSRISDMIRFLIKYNLGIQYDSYSNYIAELKVSILNVDIQVLYDGCDTFISDYLDNISTFENLNTKFADCVKFERYIFNKQNLIKNVKSILEYIMFINRYNEDALSSLKEDILAFLKAMDIKSF